MYLFPGLAIWLHILELDLSKEHSLHQSNTMITYFFSSVFFFPFPPNFVVIFHSLFCYLCLVILLLKIHLSFKQWFEFNF